MLEIKSLTKKFGGLIAVNNVSFKVRENEIVGLIGPNGAGKTTLLNMITGFLKPTSGSIFFLGKDITGFPPYYLAKLGIVRTFQNTSIFPNLSVFQNIEIATHLYRENYKDINEILKKLELEEYSRECAKSLPYGIQRKLEIAIALAVKPKLLLLDEPAAGMNPEETLELINCLKNIKEEKKFSLVIVDHNMKFITNICDRIVVLHRGEKIAEGSPREILNSKEVIEIYLGRSVYSATNQ
ncbi:MAG: ABC transporter ATP-binding protein [Dictyoglomaceae bacterium]